MFYFSIYRTTIFGVGMRAVKFRLADRLTSDGVYTKGAYCSVLGLLAKLDIFTCFKITVFVHVCLFWDPPP